MSWTTLRRYRLALTMLPATLFAGAVLAQQMPPDNPALPPPDPGYATFYQGDNAHPNPASRWGYHDGWVDGVHDKKTGHSFRPTHDDKYKKAPHYGHPDMPPAQYKQTYREAYVHGYEQGYHS